MGTVFKFQLLISEVSTCPIEYPLFSRLCIEISSKEDVSVIMPHSEEWRTIVADLQSKAKEEGCIAPQF
jgi:hypothetical protein